jgi:hypothetical protein
VTTDFYAWAAAIYPPPPLGVFASDNAASHSDLKLPGERSGFWDFPVNLRAEVFQQKELLQLLPPLSCLYEGIIDPSCKRLYLRPACLAAPLVSVVDDDESIRESLASLIRSVEFAAKVFASAEEFKKSEYPL